jgi:GT2 family glycosyltransferase
MIPTSKSLPIRILEVELSRPLPSVEAYDKATDQIYQWALSLVRLHTVPLGTVTLRLGGGALHPEEYARGIWHDLGPTINQHLEEDELPTINNLDAIGIETRNKPKCQRDRERVLSDAPFASVLVATRDHPEQLASLMDSLLALAYPHYEIIIVDNAPSTDASEELIRTKYGGDGQVTYVREDRPGLANAHNCGLEVARGAIVAITDDDVRVDRHWLAELVKGFSVAEDVGCVTGMIFPAELHTPTQWWLEQYSRFNKGFSRQTFDLDANRVDSPLYPYTAGLFGSGANMAFCVRALRDIGGFDPALGAGTVARGGDDLAAFFQIISAGYKLVYEPGAIVHHWHRREYDSLRNQAYGYGIALMAYLTKVMIDDPRHIPRVALRIPGGLAYLLNPQSPKNSPKQSDFPKELTNLERLGMLYGPFAYIRSLRQSKRCVRSSPEKSDTRLQRP